MSPAQPAASSASAPIQAATRAAPGRAWARCGAVWQPAHRVGDGAAREVRQRLGCGTVGSDIGREDLRKTDERRLIIRGRPATSIIQTRFARSPPHRRRFPVASAHRSFAAHLIALGTLVPLVPAGCGSGPQPAPERVVLVTIDTLRADRVGCYGATAGHTPQLDALAAQGVRFAVAISPAPLTLPAHASLMTALDPPGHGVRHNSIHRLDATLPTLAERMRAAGHATAAFVGAVVLAERFGLGRGFDVYDDDMGERTSGVVGYAERRANRVVDAALAWVREAPARFFLWVHFYDPHATYDPPPGFASAFASRPYAGEIAFVDAQLGRLIAGIEERWSAEGLLIVVTSDHGESLNEHGEATHSYTIYDATQRVPLVMRGPGLPAGRVIEAPVRLIDVAPTLLGLVGAQPLTEATGRDLRPLIAGAERAGRVAYIETLATQLDYRWSPLLGLRTARFKYIRAPRPELYDLEADPDETSNLAADEPDRVASFERALEERLVGARPAVSAGDLSPADRERLQSLCKGIPWRTRGSVVRYWHPDIEKREKRDLQAGYLGNPGWMVRDGDSPTIRSTCNQGGTL